MEKEKFVECLDKGQEMLRLAKSDEWDDVEAIEPEWENMLHICFDNITGDVDGIREIIKQLLEINEEIISLGRLKRQYLHEKIVKFSTGQKAVNAYQ